MISTTEPDPPYTDDATMFNKLRETIYGILMVFMVVEFCSLLLMRFDVTDV